MIAASSSFVMAKAGIPKLVKLGPPSAIATAR